MNEVPFTMTNIKRIPWAPLVAGLEITEGEVIPPLNYLADLNLEHHRVKTNILNLETLGCVPTPVRIGALPLTEDDPQVVAGDAEPGDYPPITLGPRSTIEAPFQQGLAQPFYWTSPDVAVLGPAESTLHSIEDAMAREGGAFLAPEPTGVESEGAKRIKGAAHRATLSTVARAAQDTLELAWSYTGEYLNIEAGSVVIARDFEQPLLDSATMVAYIDAVERAELPIRILLEAWQRGGRISEDEDLDALEREIMVKVIAQRKMQEQIANQQAASLKSRMGGNGNMPANMPPAPADAGATS